MSRLRAADFYYGSVLSTLLNNGITPMLIEGGEDRQIYQFTTDQKEFILFLKYRSDGKLRQRKLGNSWTFAFSQTDIIEWRTMIDQGKQLTLGLICGQKKLNQSEYVILYKDEVRQLMDINKTSITISREPNEKAFRISVGDGRNNAMQIPSARIY